MVRRSFRIGLRVGLLLGLAAAAVKMIQSRRGHQEGPAPEPWTPVAPEPTSESAPAKPRMADAPAPPIDPRPAAGTGPSSAATVSGADDRPLDEVGEPIDSPSPEAVVEEATPSPGKVTKNAAASKTSKKSGGTAKKKAPSAKASAGHAWVEPSDDTCPPSHPLKAKLSSKIFHRPGGLNYDRTNPDRCYADEASAEADGLRASKR